MAKFSFDKSKLTQRWGYKVGAVVLAVLLWSYVSITNNTNSESVYTVPVENKNLAADLTTTTVDQHVQVRVSGSGAKIESLNTSDIKAYLDFTGVEIGTSELGINVDLPDGITLVSVTPSNITVDVVKLASANFTLQADLTGDPASGYAVVGQFLSPTEVTLSGPQKYLDKVDKVYVEKNISGESASIESNIIIKVADSEGNDISDWFTINPVTANLMVAIGGDEPDKTVSVYVPLTGELANGYLISRISVKPETLKVFGNLGNLLDLYYIETEPVDISGLKETDSMKVNLNLPDGITAGNVSEATVILTIEKEKTTSFTRNVINAHNLADGLTADFDTQKVTVKLSGPASYIDALQESDVVPYVDCNGLKTGEHELDIQLELPANINVEKISPTKVTVTLSDDGE